MTDIPKKWDGRCECGHLHSEHGKSNNINYSAGSCSIVECRCKHFVMEPTPNLPIFIQDPGGNFEDYKNTTTTPDDNQQEIIYPLSDYQMMFIFSVACSSRIEKVAFTSKGKVIIDYEMYGKKCRESIPRERPEPVGIHAMQMNSSFESPYNPMEGFNINKNT